eukprot:3498261-Rhodomonas_salina.1
MHMILPVLGRYDLPELPPAVGSDRGYARVPVLRRRPIWTRDQLRLSLFERQDPSRGTTETHSKLLAKQPSRLVFVFARSICISACGTLCGLFCYARATRHPILI